MPIPLSFSLSHYAYAFVMLISLLSLSLSLSDSGRNEDRTRDGHRSGDDDGWQPYCHSISLPHSLYARAFVRLISLPLCLHLFLSLSQTVAKIKIGVWMGVELEIRMDDHPTVMLSLSISRVLPLSWPLWSEIACIYIYIYIYVWVNIYLCG